MPPTSMIPPPATGPAPQGIFSMGRELFGGKPDAASAPPDPYADREAMLKYFKEIYEECYDQRWVQERLWWRNILYALNRQWIYYDMSRNQWQDKRLAKWIPRPVTNKVWETHSAIRSIFAATELGARARPNGENPADVAAADIADKLEPAISDEHQIKNRFSMADFWLILCGNVFLHTWWDKHAEGGIVQVPYERCLACGTVSAPGDIIAMQNTCPACKSAMFENAIDPATGQQIGVSLKRGRGTTDVCSPLEIAGPNSYVTADEWPYLIRARWRTKAWWVKNHPNIAKDLRFDKMPGERSLQLLKAIPTASEIGTQGITLGAGGDSGGQIEGLTEYELWAKPSSQYPNGLFLRVCGDKGNEKIIEIEAESTPGPLPYVTEAGDPVWPWVHIPYEQFGGRVWGRAPIDVMIQKQDQLNQLDSLTILIVNRVANPVWLEPRGAEVKKFTGEPGLVVKWNPLAGVNAKPERIEGQNIPASLFQLRQQLLEDIENLTGTHDVIKGAKPTGVEAFSALQLLVERSQSRFALPLKARGEGYAKWFQLAIELERLYGPIERVYAALGPNAQWTFEHFKAADLSGAISVIVEDGSTTPKTNLGMRAAVEQLRNFGVINPADPDTLYRILQIFGQTSLMPALDVHVKAALQEQDEFERWAMTVQFTQPQPIAGPAGALAVDPATGQPMMSPPQPSAPMPGVRKPWHNDPIHIAEHTKWLNGDKMRMLLQEKTQLEQYAVMFLQQHEQALMMQQMQQAQLQAAGQPNKPGEEAGGGANGLSSSNRESGATGDVPRGTGQRADNRGPE